MKPPRFFLTARHWQLFACFMAAMFLSQFIGMATAPSAINSPQEFQRAMLPFMAVIVLFMALFLAWFWALGEFLWSLAPPALRPSIRRFRFSLIYPPAYVPVFFFSDPGEVPVLAILPLHLLAMYCMFYSLFFVAKTLRLAEVKSPVSFHDYSGAFFLLWFFPVGVWILQPRVNKLAALSA